MAPRRDGKSQQFPKVPEDIEDEILEAYAEHTDGGDFHLRTLPDFFHGLNIPKCYFNDVSECIEYYYSHIDGRGIDVGNTDEWITFQMLIAYTLTTSSNPDQLLDVVDIDKLIRNTSTLVKFRNNHSHILASWKLFVDVGAPGSNPETFRLTLPHLQAIKEHMHLDLGLHGPLGDSFLISMLSCCSTKEDGSPTSFYLDKPKSGTSITIRDFAEILGNLGELD